MNCSRTFWLIVAEETPLIISLDRSLRKSNVFLFQDSIRSLTSNLRFIDCSDATTPSESEFHGTNALSTSGLYESDGFWNDIKSMKWMTVPGMYLPLKSSLNDG